MSLQVGLLWRERGINGKVLLVWSREQTTPGHMPRLQSKAAMDNVFSEYVAPIRRVPAREQNS